MTRKPQTPEQQLISDLRAKLRKARADLRRMKLDADALQALSKRLMAERDARPAGITREVARAYVHTVSLPQSEQEGGGLLGCLDTVLDALNDFANEE